jgi:hypothetical protein
MALLRDSYMYPPFPHETDQSGAASKGGRAPLRKFVRPREAAIYLGISVSQLAHWRVNGGGPRFHKLSPGVVIYSLGDLDEFAVARDAVERS